MTTHDRRAGHAVILEIDPISPLLPVDYRLDLLGEPHGFGSFLFDKTGQIVTAAGNVWLYTTVENGGRWESWVRPLDIATLKAGPSRKVLSPRPDEDRAVLHHIIEVTQNLVVGLYCDGHGIGAAVASGPNENFVADPEFSLRPECGWETRDEDPAFWSLESNGAYVLCKDTPEVLDFWQGYDSYRRDGRKGDLGWVKLRVEKATSRVIQLERHPENPLNFRNPAWACARCGGNLASDLRIDGRHAYFYYLRPASDSLFVGLALSDDPLFFSDTQHFIVDIPRGDEVVVEKFQATSNGGMVLLFYESQANDGTWRTGLRRYHLRA